MRAVVGRQLDELAEPELGVPCSRLAALRVPAVEVLEEEPERGRLELVEPRVRADVLEVALVARAVEPEHPHALGDVFVETGDEPAVADAAEVLRRIEAERRRDPGRRDAACAEGLRGILDDCRPELRDLLERRGPAEQVHRHDRARPRRHAALDVGRVEVERLRVDVGEDRRRADARDGLGRGVEREGGADDLVPGPDLERPEHEHDRVGPVRDTDRPGHAEVRGGLFLEGADVRAEDELAPVENVRKPLLQLGKKRSVLRRRLKERNPRHAV